MVNTRTVHHPIFARLYPRIGKAMNRGGMTQRRQTLLAGLTGQVIEVDAGDGLNFEHYPPTTAHVLAIEPETHLRRLARAAARHAPVPVEVVDGLAQRIPAAADDSTDAVVVSLVLCSLPNPDTALREIHRVLKPGGQLRFLEHVRADTPGLASIQRLLDATIWPRLAGGCHLGRDTTTAIERSGFTIERLDRFQFPDARNPSSFHILGTATHPH
jgi:ubiquinone/menaquinone biosynthesis C-methylase UbiE